MREKTRQMFAKLSKHDTINFLKRVGIVLVVATLVYIPYYLLIKNNNKQSKPPISTSSVRIDLNQHLLAIQSLRNLDTTTLASAEKMEGLRNAIKTTGDNYGSNLSKYEDSPASVKLTNPRGFFKQEKVVFDLYDQSYGQLKKVIQYSVDTDLGSLNPVGEQTEIIARTDNATQSLAKISQNSSAMSHQTKQYVSLSIECLNDINKKAKSKQTDGIAQTVKTCDSIYSKARLSAISDVLKTLNTNESDNLSNQIRDVLKQLQP